MSEFLHMGGYALYVWGSYAAGGLVLAWNLVQPRLERRQLARRLRSAAAAPAEKP